MTTSTVDPSRPADTATPPPAPPTGSALPAPTGDPRRVKVLLAAGNVLSLYAAAAWAVYFADVLVGSPSDDIFMRFPLLSTFVAGGWKLTPVAVVYALWVARLGVRKQRNLLKTGVAPELARRATRIYFRVLTLLTVPILVVTVLWLALVAFGTHGFTTLPF